MKFLDALRAGGHSGIRHRSWRPDVWFRWDERMGWQWKHWRGKTGGEWTLAPLTSFMSCGVMSAPNMLDDGWEVSDEPRRST